VVARAREHPQVSQGSVEALFRWGEKRLHDFADNLFRKPYTTFYQNRPSFIEDITKKIWYLFFRDSLYITRACYWTHSGRS